MNRVLKLQLGKLCQETHLQWDTYNITTYSTIKDYVKLHEVDRAFTLWSPLWMVTSLKGIWVNLKEISELTLRQQMQALGATLKNQWLGPRETFH
jgi:hypothetical protein